MESTSRALSRDQVRDVDRRAFEEYGISGLVLMENAGRGAADLLIAMNLTGPVIIICGKGNNGGDGFVIARHLEAAGFEVRVFLIGKPEDLSGDAATNLRILQAAGLPIISFDPSDPCTNLKSLMEDPVWDDPEWIVDALLGTGISGAVREPYRQIIELINDTTASVLAVDLPSGLDCDEGIPLGSCVRATLTATFVARKSGFDRPNADEFTGPVEVLPIGVPRQLLAAYNL